MSTTNNHLYFMLTVSNRYTSFLPIALLVITNIACNKNIPISSSGLQSQITGVIESRYVLEQQLNRPSTKPPILYQGKTYYYSTSIDRTYRYDSQDQLVFAGQSDVGQPTYPYNTGYNSYTYTGNKIITYVSYTGDRDTLTLTAKGYPISSYDILNKTIYEYDKDDYLIRKLAAYQGSYQRISRVIIDGNISREVEENNRLTTTTTQQYDVSHKALPNPRASLDEGKGSRNLVLQSTTEYKRTEPLTIYGPMAPYTVSTSFTYEFDKLDRVIQQNALETRTDDPSVSILTVKRFTYNN